MKIIFSIWLLGITGLGVFSVQTVELNGIVGQSVTFPDAVKTVGTLHYGVNKDKRIGDVTGGKFTQYRDRVQWDSSTGRFSITDLNEEDSGTYTVMNNDAAQGKLYQYQLNVYIPVSVPQVNITRDTYRCTIQCDVERGTGVTLSWYREGEKKSYVSLFIRNAPDAYLPQTVDVGGVYTCEAKNSVSRETAKLTVGDQCTGQPENLDEDAELHSFSQ
ncbi:hypothetical protein AAFF_G00265270 [Aldrovandia affinis]|uniref:Ig-like domain-containing protein n=1 Tax=Aldrovandia affinis TaxID=143900 RepID=A0AAD7W2P2_9TELE|nr:hypothetical protein AAFF_G00265270 [Aldrovandia affinis]